MRGVEGMGYVGENLHISGRRITIGDDYGADAVIMWDNEKVYFNYETQKCAPSQVCGHYTQVGRAIREI